MPADLLVPPAAHSSLRTRFQTGIAFNLIGAIFNQGSTFAVNVVLAHFLGREVFGEYAMVQSTFLALALVAQLGIGSAATKYVAEFRSADPVRTGRILGMLFIFSAISGGIAALLLLLLSPWIAGSLLKTSQLAPAVAISSAVVLFAVLNGFLIGALAGLESYREMARALIYSGLAYVVVCVSLAWWGGLNGAVIGIACSGLVEFFLLAATLRRECSLHGIRLNYLNIASERGIFLKFALPAALAGFTSMPALWAANAMLVRQPGGYLQMAVYSASFSLMSVILFFPNIANNVGMSMLNNQKGAGNERGYRRTFWANLLLICSAAVFAAGAAALFGPQLLRLFGKSFKDGYPALLVLLLSTVPQVLATALYQIIQSQAKMWLSFAAVSTPRDILIVVLSYLLVARHGATGLAVAYAISWAFALVAIASIVYRLGLHPNGTAVMAA